MDATSLDSFFFEEIKKVKLENPTATTKIKEKIKRKC